MRKHRYLAGAGIVGLAFAFAATPAFAAEDEADESEISTEAIGTFNGFHFEATEQAIKAARLTADFSANPNNTYTYNRLVQPTPELIVRDDIGVNGSADVNNTLPSVVQLFIRNNTNNGTFFNCTGTLINPRTVLTAAHCVNSNSSEAYGLAGQAPLTMWISTGINSSTRLFNTIGDTTRGYDQGGVARSTDVVIHPSSGVPDGGLPFPYGDVALIALDQPVTDVPSMPILLSPLTQLTHVIVTGYGTNGTGDTGGTNAGNRFLRRVGENMLDMIGSNADFIDGVFPGAAPSSINFGVETQTMYWIDFDDPNRTPADLAGCSFTGLNISCTTLAAVDAIDWFGGDALPQEAGTAPGDSGSPIIVDQLYDFPIVAGVLSGGYDFFGRNNRYGDVSFYNPLFPFFEFITQNTPYKYVSAKGGSGNWSDPNRWTQDLDPGFFVDDGNGNLVNGIPTGSETGVYDTGNKLGTVIGDDVSDNSTDFSPDLPPTDTPEFGANLPESSVLLGPGSSGFVPNNTDGVVGTAFENPAQYFDVLLHRHGVTTVDINVLIDKLAVDNDLARLILPRGITLTSLIGFEQYRGHTSIDGTLNAGVTALFGGRLNGIGTITTDVFFNVAGQIYPRTTNGIGTLTIDGDYVQTPGGGLFVDITAVRLNNANDVLRVTGNAILDGTLVVNPLNRVSPRYGATFAVLNAASIDGNFSNVMLVTDSPLLFASSRVENNEVLVEIGARRIATVMSSSSGLASVGNALDTLRFSGRYTAFEHLFGVVDGASYLNFGQTLASLTPTSGFAQAASANGFSQRFTGQIAQRTLNLRGAGPAASGFSAAGNATFAQAGTAPGEPGKLGFFGSVSGSFLDMAKRDHSLGSTAVEDAAFLQAGELTIGADYRVSDGVAVGIAVTNIRNSAQSVSGFRPNEDESVAAAAYGAATFGKGFADMYVGYASQSYGMERASQGDFTGSYRSALGSANGAQTFAGMRVGYALQPAKGLTVGPVASLDYVRSELGGFTEYGAGSFGLTVRERTFTSLGAKLGAMAALDVNLGKTSKLTAFGSVAYARELADKQDIITAAFAGAEDVPFTIANQLDPQWVSVNAGAELSLSDRLSTKMSVTSDLGRGVLTNNQANLSLNWKF
ncbi:MAG: autotransporter domain-containing protein [Sphingomonadaceae bacterium]|nr:autotransporter domain-containing protein [Sphingomonadaceae bacterium]